MTRAGRLRLRPGPLLAAAGLAAIFVVARIVYRVLFHGADGIGPVVLPLPAVRLPAPFSWVTLLGPVTLDGLWEAVVSALPVAAVILLFGMLNAAFDISRAFGALARRGPLRGIARALAVAWSTLPALGAAVRRVRLAQRLRGERSGPRMLVPVLERTLERATAIATGLELRGLGSTTGEDASAASARGEQYPVTVSHAELGFGERRVLSLPRFTLAHGTLAVVTGPTGSGKSTLLRALAGLHDHVDGGWSTGTIAVAGRPRRETPPRDTSRVVGVVLQNPREVFCTERVRDEIGLALQLRDARSEVVSARVAEVAAQLRIIELLDRRLETLSAGEATLVAIAAAIVERPALLLVDEPLADLDTAARRRVASALETLAHRAEVCLLVAEHRWAAFAETADTWWSVDADAGALVVQPGPPSESDVSSDVAETPEGADRDLAEARGGFTSDPAAVDPEALADHLLPGEPPSSLRPVLAASGLRVAHGGTVAVHDARLAVAAGEIAALIGPNGAGKSSLLMALALPPRGAPVEGRAALVPDSSDDLFTHDSVAAECARSDHLIRRATGAPPEVSAADRFATFLGLDGPGLAERMPRHPLDLSLGERRCLAIALQLARSPGALLIDEPTRGLDADARRQVRVALRQAAEAGTAVLLATHDAGFAASLGACILPMREGVVPAAPPSAEAGAGARHPESIRREISHASGDPDAVAGVSPGSSRQNDRTRVRGDSRPSAARLTDAVAGARHPESFRREDSHPSGVLDSSAGVSPGSSRQNDRTNGSPPAPRVRGSAAWTSFALIAANLVALASFTWPLVASALPAQAEAAAPWAALALIPVAALIVLAALDESVRSAHALAYLGVLAAIGTAVRITSTGVGGVEAVFILLILAGRAFGARFGMLLGAATIALSSTVFGGFGPWTPFQMFACAWVGAGAGLLSRRAGGRVEIALLCVYGVLASYAFGLLMNVWFWPFAVGTGAAISYEPGAPLEQNLGSFLLYSLVTSTAGWDTLRAITTVVGLVLIGGPVLAALRRAKPVMPSPAASTPTPLVVAHAPAE